MHFPWYPSGQVEISTSARNLLTPFRALAELAGFAAPAGLQIQLEQGGSLNPEMPAMLGCAYGLHPAGCRSKCSLFARSLGTLRDFIPSSRRRPGSIGFQ
jgi:hypothetical protein